jgi:hypothetical protein
VVSVNSRLRKAVGGLGMLVFLGVYTVAAVTIAGTLPDNRAVHLVYFVVAGLAWCLPLFPWLSWMENGRRPRRR